MRPENLFENQATIKVLGVGGAGSTGRARATGGSFTGCARRTEPLVCARTRLPAKASESKTIRPLAPSAPLFCSGESDIGDARCEKYSGHHARPALQRKFRIENFFDDDIPAHHEADDRHHKAC